MNDLKLIILRLWLKFKHLLLISDFKSASNLAGFWLVNFQVILILTVYFSNYFTCDFLNFFKPILDQTLENGNSLRKIL